MRQTRPAGVAERGAGHLAAACYYFCRSEVVGMEEAKAFVSQLHAVDVIIGVIVATCAVRGYARGFLGEILSLVALLCAIAAAFRWTPDAVKHFGNAIPGTGFSDTGIAFLVVFGAAGMALRVLVTAIERMSLPAVTSPINRLGGAAFGACKGVLVLGCAVLILRALAPQPAVADAKTKGNPLLALSAQISAAPLAAHVTQWTGGLLTTVAHAAEGRIKTLAASSGDAG
jgi:uncharacterized membrane protein required for colicin V production